MECEVYLITTLRPWRIYYAERSSTPGSIKACSLHVAQNLVFAPPPPPPPPLWCYRPLTLNSPCNPDTPVTRMVRRNQLARTPLKTKLYELDDARVCYTRRPLHSTFGTENVGGSGKTQGENVNGVVSRQGVWASA